MTIATDIVDAVVIGAGWAGLGVSHALAQRGLRHRGLERGRIGETWRTQRWDSFRLNTPNIQTVMPGDTYLGPVRYIHKISVNLEFEVLGFDISRAMHDAENHNPVRIRSVINASLPIRVSAQTFRNMVARRAREIHFRDPGYFCGQISKELQRIVRAALGDVASDASQVGESKRSDNKCFRANRLSLRPSRH